MKDYYKVLGVSEKATKNEIKKAFHALAKKYHPDINKGNKAAEDMFKDVSEAYEVLGNDESRKKYDSARSFGNAFNFGGFSQDGPFGDYYKKYSDVAGDASDMFSELLKNLTKSSSPFDNIKNVFDYVVNGTTGGEKPSSGSSSKGGFASYFKKSPSADAVVKIPLKIALNGGAVKIDGLPGGNRPINIPANTANNSIVEIGPFKVLIQIAEDEHFKFIDKNNLKAILTVNIAQAILGSKIRFTDPRGESLILAVPKGTKTGDKVKLTGKGLPGGDLVIEFSVVIPDNLNDEQCRIFSEAARKIGWKF